MNQQHSSLRLCNFFCCKRRFSKRSSDVGQKKIPFLTTRTFTFNEPMIKWTDTPKLKFSTDREISKRSCRKTSSSKFFWLERKANTILGNVSNLILAALLQVLRQMSSQAILPSVQLRDNYDWITLTFQHWQIQKLQGSVRLDTCTVRFKPQQSHLFRLVPHSCCCINTYFSTTKDRDELDWCVNQPVIIVARKLQTANNHNCFAILLKFATRQKQSVSCIIPIHITFYKHIVLSTW